MNFYFLFVEYIPKQSCLRYVLTFIFILQTTGNIFLKKVKIIRTSQVCIDHYMVIKGLRGLCWNIQ